MATKKPAVKKPTAGKKPAKAIKKPVKAAKSAKTAPAKKIAVKPPVKAKPVKKAEKKGLGTKMTKLTVDRVALPKGGKIFVKAAKRPAAKKTVKKAK